MSKSARQIPILGIDLGTVCCLACVHVDGKDLFVCPDVAFVDDPSKVRFRSQMMPSAFFYCDAQCAQLSGEKEGVKLGDRALEYLLRRETANDVVRFVKRRMRYNNDVRLKLPLRGKHRFSPAEISGHYISALVRAAEIELKLQKGDIREAVVTVPAYFGTLERDATYEAGERANLKKIHLLDEPVAAAVGMRLHEQPPGRLLLVVDLGGGTLDVTLLLTGGSDKRRFGFQELGRSGDSELGGLDWDTVLAHEVAAETKPNVDDPTFCDIDNLRLYEACEKAKRQLCNEAIQGVIPVEYEDRRDGLLKGCRITRDRFLDATDPLVQWCAKVCDNLFEELRPEDLKAIGKTRLGWSDLDGIYMAGGGSKMPAVRKILAERWGREPILADEPQHAVARGAAIAASMLANWEDLPGGKLPFTPRSPHSIGLMVGNPAKPRYREIISRNTPIGASKEFNLPVRGGQGALAVNIVERVVTRLNPQEERPIATMYVDDLPPANGQPERIYFKVHVQDHGISFDATFLGRPVQVFVDFKKVGQRNGSL